MRRWFAPALVVLALLASGCGDPPHKEMDQAQGAIDAAKAAGADRYAAAEYTAAVDALKRSHDAVAQSDYRLALNHAIDSRERAQNAARQAADTRAQVRGEAERTMAEIGGLMAQATVKLDAARKARGPRSSLTDAAREIAALNRDVQKAGEAMKAGDYMAAQPLLREIKARVENVIAEFDGPGTTQSPRRRR